MTQQEALERFEEWYSDCIDSGIEPENIVRLVGNMCLITNEEAIEFLKINDFI